MSEHVEPENPSDPKAGSSPAEPSSTQPAPDEQVSWGAGWPPPAGSTGWQRSDGYPPPGPTHWGYPPAGPGWGGPSWAPPAWGPPTQARPSRRRRRYLRPIATAGLALATVGAGVGVGHLVWSPSSTTPTAASAPSSSSGSSGTPFSGSGGTNPSYGSGSSGSSGGGSSSSNGSAGNSGPSDASSIAAKVDPALVDINVTFDGEDPGAGTGIVLTSKGEVLTNNHVVEGATSIRVTDLGNGKTYGATVVGYDRTDDVAVIQLTGASGLQTAKIGDSSKLAVGDGVVAIGNAGGTGGTPTATGGSITALGQAITASDEVTGTDENLTGLIETNASIQPGDSGGSLVNTSGEVVGMDTAASEGYSLSSQTSQGYAIPINKALSIASKIESGSSSSTIHVGPTAYLGVLVSSSNTSTSPYSGGYYDPYGGQNGSSASGVAISGVVSGGPAAKVGLAEDDVITSIGGHNVTSASDLTNLLQGYKPGASVQITWTDTSGASHTATITLGSGPAQ